MNHFSQIQNILIKLFSFAMLGMILTSSPVFASYTPEQQAQIDAIEQQNAAFKAQLDSLYSQERTLANEIAIADAQATALQKQISDTQIKINITNEQLNTTATQIKAAEEELARQKSNLNEYIRVMYMDGKTSQIELVLTSQNFSDFVNRSEYLDNMQAHIQETMTKINATKTELETKKKQLDTDRASLDVLKEGQLSQISALNSQIEQKDRLISGNKATQGDLQSRIEQNNANSYVIKCLASGACGSSSPANAYLSPVNSSAAPFGPYYNQGMYGLYETYAPGYTFARWGCLITSLGMAHGKEPKVEARDHRYSDGEMIGDSSSGRGISSSAAISTLQRGGKVVIGVSTPYGPHFVLGVGYSDGKILINDPSPGIAPNGYDNSQVIKFLAP